MNSKIFISAVLAIGSLALTGCKESYLDADQKSNISADDYFATETGFESLAAAPYYKLRAIYGDDPQLFCSGTDLYDKGRSNYSSATLSSYSTLVSTESSVLSFYEACYDGIQQANAVIKYAADDKDRQLRAAEAKVLKAYYYYLLSQQFGGVPISDEYISSVQLDFPKKSLDEVYQYIVDILTKVESDNYLPKSDSNGRVSKAFLYNLLAKTYLAWGWDSDVTVSDAGLSEGQAATVTSKDKFNKAAEYAEDALNAQGRTLTLTFSNMWDVKNENNNNVIFAVKYTPGISGQDDATAGNQQQSEFSNYYNDDAGDDEDPGQSKYTSSQYAPSNKLIYLFEPGDDRFEGTFMVTQLKKYKYFYTGKTQTQGYNTVYGYYPAWYTDLSKISSYNSASDANTTAIVSSSSDPSVYVSASVNARTGKITYKSGTRSYETSRTTTGTALCVRKFDDYTTTRNGTKGVSYHDIILAHVSETYLLAAEAYYMAGYSDKARECLNTVRARSNASQLINWSDYVRHYSDGEANTATKKNYNDGTEGWLSLVPCKKGVTDLDPIDIILDERARELCGEYYRWMDLRRTKRLIDYNVKYNSAVSDASAFKGVDGKNKWYRPIPEDEINLNSSLTEADQNDGYKSSAN